MHPSAATSATGATTATTPTIRTTTAVATTSTTGHTTEALVITVKLSGNVEGDAELPEPAQSIKLKLSLHV